MALTLWVGVDGSSVGTQLKDGSHVAFGAFAIFLPVILVGCGVLILRDGIGRPAESDEEGDRGDDQSSRRFAHATTVPRDTRNSCRFAIR